MAMVKTVRAAPPMDAKASRQAASPGTQWAEVMAASRPPGGSIEKAERIWRRSASWRMRSIPGVAENGGFISTTVGRTPGRKSARASALWRVTAVPGNKPASSPARTVAISFRCRCPAARLRKRALRHDDQHAGAGRGLQHGVAGADGGGPERGVGERQRGRELLEPDLVLGALRVRGLQRGDRRQHRQHFPGAVRAGAGPLAHGAPVTLHEQHHGGLRRFVGVLPDPGAVGVARSEGAGHGVAERRGVERPAGFEHGEQGPGGVEERRGAVHVGGRAAGGRD